MELKLIPKPEGFDLRDRRSDKTALCTDWQPIDALYDAQQAILKGNCSAVMVIYTECAEDGTTSTRYRLAGPLDSGYRLLINALGKFMGWQK